MFGIVSVHFWATVLSYWCEVWTTGEAMLVFSIIYYYLLLFRFVAIPTLFRRTKADEEWKFEADTNKTKTNDANFGEFLEYVKIALGKKYDQMTFPLLLFFFSPSFSFDSKACLMWTVFLCGRCLCCCAAQQLYTVTFSISIPGHNTTTALLIVLANKIIIW